MLRYTQTAYLDFSVSSSHK